MLEREAAGVRYVFGFAPPLHQAAGQDVFRAGHVAYWDGQWAVTGLAVTELLRARHIMPWADCESDAERLDIFNWCSGLWLVVVLGTYHGFDIISRGAQVVRDFRASYAGVLRRALFPRLKPRPPSPLTGGSYRGRHASRERPWLESARS